MSNFSIHHQHQNRKYHHELLSLLKQNIDLYSPLYSRTAIAYYRQLAEDDGLRTECKSFILATDNNPFFAFVGFKFTNASGFSAVGTPEIPSTFIELPTLTRSMKKFIASSLDKFILDGKYECYFLDMLSGGRFSFASDHILSLNGSRHHYKLSRFVDLTRGEDELRKSLRKSYLSLINWGIRNLKIEIHTKGKVTWETFLEFRRLHIREAGRETRSLATWEKQYESVCSDEAFCITGSLDGQLVSAGYFIIDGYHCYYGSSASRRDLFHKPLFHSLMWKALLEAKARGARSFETGEMYPYNITNRPEHISTKQIQIAKFKAGFGGDLRPSLIIGYESNEKL